MMKYKSEEDRCYGVAGMAIGLSIWNGEDMVYAVDIDDDANGYITFTPEYYYTGHPTLATVDTWNTTLKHYQMTVGMLLANLFCRCIKERKQLGYEEARSRILESVREEGRSICQLEDDEINKLFQDTFSYLEQVFSNSSVLDILHTLAARLQTDRRLDNSDIKALLGVLDQ